MNEGCTHEYYGAVALSNKWNIHIYIRNKVDIAVGHALNTEWRGISVQDHMDSVGVVE